MSLNSLESCFRELGLSPKEQKVYISLAQEGRLGASVVAKRCGLPRSTAYSVLEALVKRGLVSQEQDVSQSLYLPNKPSAFLRMVEREREEQSALFQARERAAREVMNLIGPLFQREEGQSSSHQFFEGRVNVRNMLYDCFNEWVESIRLSDGIWWGYEDSALYLNYSEWVTFRSPVIERQVEARIYSASEKMSISPSSPYIVHPLESDFQFQYSGSVWAMGDYVVTLMCQQDPHVAVMVKNSAIAESHRNMFRFLQNGQAHEGGSGKVVGNG